MHKIAEKEFTLEDFSCGYLFCDYCAKNELVRADTETDLDLGFTASRRTDVWHDILKRYLDERICKTCIPRYLPKKENKIMTLYVVHGNTYYSGYGYIEKIFGVYTEKDAAEAAEDLVTKELYEKNVNDKWTRVENLSDVDVDILEIEADKLVEIELGGYCE